MKSVNSRLQTIIIGNCRFLKELLQITARKYKKVLYQFLTAY